MLKVEALLMALRFTEGARYIQGIWCPSHIRWSTDLLRLERLRGRLITWSFERCVGPCSMSHRFCGLGTEQSRSPLSMRNDSSCRFLLGLCLIRPVIKRRSIILTCVAGNTRLGVFVSISGRYAYEPGRLYHSRSCASLERE